MYKRRVQTLLLSALLTWNMTGIASAEQLLIAPAPPAAQPAEEVVILYTNDVHTHIDNEGLRYSNVAALKKELEAEGAEVLLVDAGDHIQGTAYGSSDKGETVIRLMNAAGYDLATPGNHEFDYGIERLSQLTELAEFSYVSANFYHEKDGVRTDMVFEPYKVFDLGETEVAFVGVTTPEAFTKSTPEYFWDDEGNYIYGIAAGDDGAELYHSVQSAIDAASKEADVVIALAHLGDELASRPWTSEDVIANTTGLDALIDGHSHTTMEGTIVKDKDGNDVLLTQTGEYLNAVGKMTIAADGSVSTELVTDCTALDETVKALEDSWIGTVNDNLGQVIGSVNDTLDNYDAEGNRLVRMQETNTGNFAADALYYLFDNMDMDVDAALVNGGCIRNNAVTGPISYLTCKEIHIFGNVACLQTVTGQQILDALEWGAKDAGISECGGFLHVSGLKYTIDTNIPSTVQKDDKGMWTGGPTGGYRVKQVEVLNRGTGEYEALDLNRKYNIAGYNYTLRQQGDGFAMFDGAVNVLDYVMEDYLVLANYVESFAGKVVTGYAEPQGRIRITDSAGAQEAETTVTETAAGTVVEIPGKEAMGVRKTYTVLPGDSLWKIAAKELGNGNRWKEIYTLNSGMIVSPDLIYKGQILTLP